MSDDTGNTTTYEQRHKAALEAIRAVALAPKDDTELREAQARLSEANQANSELRSELETLKAQRSRDVAELDALIAQLKPLIGET